MIGSTSHTTGLQPKYIVPPVPHPCPHDHMSLLATKEGLLIRPFTSGSVAHVRISWGKAVRVEEIASNSGGDAAAEWAKAVIVYGIIGFLELFSGSHLLVITSKAEVGTVIDPRYVVYEVKGVAAIPLVEDHARTALSTIASRRSPGSSLVSSTALDGASATGDFDTVAAPDAQQLVAVPSVYQKPSAPRVQFSSNDQVKSMPASYSHFDDSGETSHLLELPASSSPRSSLSDESSHSLSSEHSVSTSPIAKTLASRLSFWSRLSKRTSHPSTSQNDTVPESLSLLQEQEVVDEIIERGNEEPARMVDSILAATAPPPASVEEKQTELERKIIRECIKEFSKGGMYFAYNFDITRSLQHKQDQAAKSQDQYALLVDLNALPSPTVSKFSSDKEASVEGTKINPLREPNPTLPLWRRVDKRFWWNEWLLKPFVDAGLHSYVLPVMQGYFQVARFNIPPNPITHDDDTSVEYTIISRRSRYRAGLRYQRRGIDEDANVANFVETETIMRVERLGVENVFAYVQIRGSIPLFWTQTGYGLKPPPLLASDRTHAQNLDMLRRHFNRTVSLYGPHTILNLAEQSGKEGPVTDAYREYMHELDSKDARYQEYDFHNETRGMKYENLSKLISALDKTFDSQGYFWVSDNAIMSRQKAVFRVNCIDCLDRTNVVQSAFARFILNKQLGAAALLNPEDEGRTEIDHIFNDVWANNGDAISREYAGTSALKGDFTRTGKRDLSGLLNDGVNSLARMYTSTFSDWFNQAVIDFMLGNRTLSVFSEFLLKLQSTDPRDLIRLSKIRAEAIATSVSRVLAEDERLLSGWTLFSPEELNSKIRDKFEEKILLLTARALYIISYDYTLEKVKLYTRVPLGDIVGISKGVYILSPLEEASRDPVQNAGFVVTWLTSQQTTRVSSYSLRNTLETPSTLPRLSLGHTSTINPNLLKRSFTRSGPTASTLSKVGQPRTFAAFKVLPIDPARMRRASTGGDLMYAETADELSDASNCQEAADLIVDSIRRAREDVGVVDNGFVTNEDVVSLAEAQRMTSVYAKMEYGVKRLLWLGG